MGSVLSSVSDRHHSWHVSAAVANSTEERPCQFCQEIQAQGKDSKPPVLTAKGKWVLGISVGSALTMYGLLLPFVMPGFRKICLPFIPATNQQIRNIIRVLKGRSGNCIDLGSGDGRIVLELAKYNRHRSERNSFSRIDGVELNRWLVWWSKMKAFREKSPRSEARFFKGDIMRTDLSRYDNIIVFGVESLMEQLEVKMGNELVPNAIVVACRFPFPNWQPLLVEGTGIDKVWVYTVESIKEPLER